MNYFAIGFGAVAVAALGAIDYANQANAAGEAPGSYSAAAYFATYIARVASVRAARDQTAETSARDERREAGARIYLPDAPAGWTRRAWTEGDNSALQMPERKDLVSNVPDLLKNMAAKSAHAAEERRNAETWVYQQGDQMIAVRAKYQPRDDARSLTGAVGDTIAATAGAMAGRQGWAVIDGVAYGRTLADLAAPGARFTSRAGTPFDAFEAPIGLHDAVQISVLSNAAERDLSAVLGAIDYDGLNGLLSYSLAHIGSDAPSLPPEAEADMADAMLKMHGDLLSRRSQEAQAWMQRAMSPENAMKMMVNELAHGWGAEGLGPMDPGKAPEPELPEDETAQARGMRAIADFAALIFGDSDAKTTETDAPKAKDTPKPGRLTLSGGTSCLQGSAGKFCRD
jgi:hypothetical protein